MTVPRSTKQPLAGSGTANKWANEPMPFSDS